MMPDATQLRLKLYLMDGRIKEGTYHWSECLTRIKAAELTKQLKDWTLLPS